MQMLRAVPLPACALSTTCSRVPLSALGAFGALEDYNSAKEVKAKFAVAVAVAVFVVVVVVVVVVAVFGQF